MDLFSLNRPLCRLRWGLTSDLWFFFPCVKWGLASRCLFDNNLFDLLLFQYLLLREYCLWNLLFSSFCVSICLRIFLEHPTIKCSFYCFILLRIKSFECHPSGPLVHLSIWIFFLLIYWDHLIFKYIFLKSYCFFLNITYSKCIVWFFLEYTCFSLVLSI